MEEDGGDADRGNDSIPTPTDDCEKTLLMLMDGMLMNMNAIVPKIATSDAASAAFFGLELDIDMVCLVV